MLQNIRKYLFIIVSLSMAALSAAESTSTATTLTADTTKNDLRTSISTFILTAKQAGGSFSQRALQSVQRWYEAILPYVQTAKEPISFIIKNITPTALLATLIYISTTKARKLTKQLDGIIKLQEQLSNTTLQLQSATTANKASIETLSLKLQKQLDDTRLQLQTAMANNQSSIDVSSIKLQKRLDDTAQQLQRTIADNKTSTEINTTTLQEQLNKTKAIITENKASLGRLEKTQQITEEARINNSNSISPMNIYKGVTQICVALGLKEVVTRTLGYMGTLVAATDSAPTPA